jgi:hypothetical protein
MPWIKRALLSALFAVTLFVSSALLFFVQPFFAKLVLPLLGGTPAVWNTCAVFFQTALLAGYAYAHATTAWLGLRGQALLHGALLLAALVFLPPVLSHAAGPPDVEHPIPWLLRVLLGTVGLPFLVLSAGGPLLQKWFAATGHPAARDPYFLYGASNLGSLLALLGYPVLVEPFFPLTGRADSSAASLLLRTQAGLWTAGYLLLLGLTVACVFFVRREGKISTAEEIPPERPPLGRRLRWLALAFVPSSLMLSVTTYLTTDIAAIPLLWVVPLSLYLVTFILAFARRRLVPRSSLRHLQPLVILLLALVLLSEATEPVVVLVALHLGGFLAIALACHGELADDRPAPRYLTEFYLWLAAGGALGGIFNGLLAPLLFNSIAEYPAALVLAALLLSPPKPGWAPRRDLAWAVAFGAATALWLVLCQALGLPPGQLTLAVVFGPAAVVCYTFWAHRLRFALGVAALLASGVLYHGVHGRSLYRERSFFGVHRVTREPGGGFNELVHGNTVHGRQSLDPERRRLPLTYYHPTGPIGRLFPSFTGSRAKRRVAVVGLGAGSLAAYAQAGQQWTFYEIDPAVARIAQDPRFFTFLSDCPAEVTIRLGDARLTLADAPDQAYDLLVIDAFSSDAIPLHLLTREALHLYLCKLTPDGLLAFHVSNRYLSFEQILADLAQDAGLPCYSKHDLNLLDAEREEGKSPSQWVCLPRRKEDEPLLRWRLWERVPPRPHVPVWTDEFSNLLGILKWE